jgi:hypothetical protein
MSECEISLRNSSEGCICDVAVHNYWKFGDNHDGLYDSDFENDYMAKSHKLYFESLQNTDNEIKSVSNDSNASDYSDDILIDESLVPDELFSYFRNCSCDYCRHIKCIIDDVFQICLCCETKIFFPEDLIVRCDECNCTLCKKCFIHGRYHDEKYCYNCRKFSVHKNINYYFPNTKTFNAYNDWMDASYYY